MTEEITTIEDSGKKNSYKRIMKMLLAVLLLMVLVTSGIFWYYLKVTDELETAVKAAPIETEN